MSNSIILLPFIVAFLLFIFRFYSREAAASMANPSFLLAVATVFIAILYLVLGIVGALPAYGTLAAGVTGLVLLGLSILRLFMI
jgi:quinol-cytochrome oxidoreductase complex cytochrome b subunit